ncbi:MAG: excinuclease ABC subunit UvrA, partial [Planctomycetes bacterium]|nr:excinuclease ABC subunit UvrA [Planctomycetota bacterium]
IRGARHHNLQGIDVRIPLRCLVAVTGVSGSGKSSLVIETLLPAAARALGDRRARPGAHDGADGMEHIDGVVAIDQVPIGRTPRSNPATYTGVFRSIRALFAGLPESRARGYGPRRFSFNARGGRCEDCEGAGLVRVDLEFLAGVEIPCDTCRGRRYNRETLEIRYRGRTIAEVLETPIADAIGLFAGEDGIVGVLKLLESVGLGYVPLGQPATSLSAGEAQRVKLAAALARPAKGRALYVLDEPTRGLHLEDVGRLIGALRALIGRGGSVVVVEHHSDVIAAADHVIDLGPGAGPAGGRIVAEGPPEAIAADPRSRTGRALARRERVRIPRAPEAPGPAPGEGIEVRGARTHNLRAIDVDIPWNRLTVVTGPSGSGKTSLVLDTIHAEARRRFLEALSTRARALAGRIEPPPVDRIEGLGPTIAVDRSASAAGPRATVATASEVHDLARLLWARAGEPYCPACQIPLRAFSPSRAAGDAIARFGGAMGYVLAPLSGIEATGAAPPRREAEALCRWLLAEGFTRLLLGKEEVSLEDATPVLGAREDEFLVIDRVRFEGSAQGRIAASFEEAFRRASGRAAAGVAGDAIERYARLPACPACGFALAAPLAPRHFSPASPEGACERCAGRGEVRAGRGLRTCPACGGERIRPAARAVRAADWRIGDFLRLPIDRALSAVAAFDFTGGRARVAEPIIADLRARLRFLADVGVGYITLDRRADTLSAGEGQRIRLAAQLGAALSGAVYILDEPSLGLHARDIERLAASLRVLRDRGNTVIVVEHDEGLIRAADRVIALGPGGGSEGGRVVAAGPPAAAVATARACAPLPPPTERSIPGAARPADRPPLIVREARLHNLKGFDVAFPRGCVTAVAGVSGSGKSSLVQGVLAPAVRAALRKRPVPSGCRAIEGLEGIARVASLAATPIGRTPAAIPATYAGIFGAIRTFFALLPQARRKGFDASRFSFRRPAGRCPSCRGLGYVRARLEVFADVWIPCASCGTRRYNRETLEVRYRGRTIADVLSATVGEAIDLFRDHPRIAPVLAMLARVGLGYLPLGQPANTLSAGEAQRLRIARVLGAPRRGETLYVLDEPTSGLASHEVGALVDVLIALARRGDTVVVIEHHLGLIRRADRVIELGPEAGEEGGFLLYEGDPDGLAGVEGSPTARYLGGAAP